VNILHRWYCKSDGWAEALQRYIIPTAVAEDELGDDVLEIGPGPGLATDWLATRAARVTAVEIDHKLATDLAGRFEGSNVVVVEGDATKMTFADGTFSSAVCLTMLHHVPTTELQDRLLAQACRVLRPGGKLFGSDSTTSGRFRLFHLFDTCLPVHPPEFAARLEAAGFSDPEVEWNQQYNSFRFSARRPD
jgi:SAM-dependent methyltransferase